MNPIPGTGKLHHPRDGPEICWECNLPPDHFRSWRIWNTISFPVLLRLVPVSLTLSLYQLSGQFKVKGLFTKWTVSNIFAWCVPFTQKLIIRLKFNFLNPVVNWFFKLFLFSNIANLLNIYIQSVNCCIAQNYFR